MPETGLGHTADRHIGVADRLDLLQSATGDNVVERGEILVENANERRGLGSFGQERKALEICKQDCRGAYVPWLHAPVFLELVGNCGWQQVVEEFLGSRCLRGDLLVRLVELPDRPVMLDQPSAQLQ